MADIFDRLSQIKQNTEEVERSQRADILQDKFKLEDETLLGIERVLNRHRMLSYMDARTVIDAYRVIKGQRKEWMDRITALDSRCRALEAQVERYKLSAVRRGIRSVVEALKGWTDAIGRYSSPHEPVRSNDSVRGSEGEGRLRSSNARSKEETQ